MKKALSYMMLFVYTTMLLKPVSPFIFDFAAHLLQYEEHIKTVHHEHGKYHVHDEYSESAKKALTDNAPAPVKKESCSAEFVITSIPGMIRPIPLPPVKANYLAPELDNRDLSHDYPPPRC